MFLKLAKYSFISHLFNLLCKVFEKLIMTFVFVKILAFLLLIFNHLKKAS